MAVQTFQAVAPQEAASVVEWLRNARRVSNLPSHRSMLFLLAGCYSGLLVARGKEGCVAVELVYEYTRDGRWSKAKAGYM